MKNNQTILIAAGLLFLAVGCNKENASIESPDETVVSDELVTEIIKADTKEDKTKADINADAEFTWTVGDLLAVHVSKGDSHKYVITTGGADAAAAEASFTVQYENDYVRDGFAVYPSSIVEENDANYGQSGSPLRVKLPDEYTLAQVSETRTPCPMIAVNAPENNWAFKQLCAMLRVTLNNIPPSTEYIKLTFGHNVAGYFNIPSEVEAGESVIAYANAAGSNSTAITITDLGLTTDWMDGQDINIPIPTGTYTTNSVTVAAYDDEDHVILTMSRPLRLAGDWTAARKSARKIVASLPAFSVSDDARIHIAKSNLQVAKTDNSKTWAEQEQLDWSFMPYSWSRETETDMAVDFSNKNVIRIFSWGSTGHNFNAGKVNPEDYVYGQYYQPWNTPDGTNRIGTEFGPIGTAVNLTGDFAYGDWGRKICVEDNKALDDGYGESKDWRLPTSNEMIYMLGKTADPTYDKRGDYITTGDAEEGTTCYTLRHNSWSYYCINSDTSPVRGLIIVPDYFVDPTGIFIKCARNPDVSQFTAEQWSLMEKAGAAFIPNSVRFLWNSMATSMTFWTSTGEPTAATHAKVLSSAGNGDKLKIGALSNLARRSCIPVRLVRDLN